MRSTFHLVFKTYKEKNLKQSGRDPQNYMIEKNWLFAFEQNRKKNDMFNADQKKKKKFWKKKEKATRGSWNTQGSEATKNADIEKEDEQELWEWLKTLYKEFENINESKKEAR